MNASSVKKIIQNVVDKIDEDPFIIHREADIQAMIYNELCKEYPPGIYKNKLGYKTGLVHCEYYFGKDKYDKHNRKTFDVVIFNENDVENINNNWLAKSDEKKKSQWDIIRLKDIIEIKAEFGLSGNKFGDFDGSREKEDIKKLIEFKKLHNYYEDLSLHFICFLRLEKKGKEKYEKRIEPFFEQMKKYCERENIEIEIYTNKNHFVNARRCC
jgi:hypothetical protein